MAAEPGRPILVQAKLGDSAHVLDRGLEPVADERIELRARSLELLVSYSQWQGVGALCVKSADVLVERFVAAGTDRRDDVRHDAVDGLGGGNQRPQPYGQRLLVAAQLKALRPHPGAPRGSRAPEP